LPDSKIYEPNAEDLEAIQKLSIEKYQTWEWIFGYSPKYRFTNKLETENGEIHITFLVEKGLLAEVSVSGDISDEICKLITASLLDSRHDYLAVKSALGEMDMEFLLHNLPEEIVLKLLF
jgi:lipoate-protein ligase A